MPAASATKSGSVGPSEFEQQLPLAGQFVTQGTETAGSVRIERRDDGAVWATLTDFRTGAAPDLRLYLNEGSLVKNPENAWTTEAGLAYEIASVSNSISTQEFEVRGSRMMTEIHSVTIADYSTSVSFGSAALQ